MSKFVLGDKVISNYPVGSDNANRFGTNRNSEGSEGRIGTIEGTYTNPDAKTSDDKVFIVQYSNFGGSLSDKLAFANESDLLHLPERRIADLEKAVEKLTKSVYLTNIPSTSTVKSNYV